MFHRTFLFVLVIPRATVNITDSCYFNRHPVDMMRHILVLNVVFPVVLFLKFLVLSCP